VHGVFISFATPPSPQTDEHTLTSSLFSQDKLCDYGLKASTSPSPAQSIN